MVMFCLFVAVSVSFHAYILATHVNDNIVYRKSKPCVTLIQAVFCCVAMHIENNFTRVVSLNMAGNFELN